MEHKSISPKDVIFALDIGTRTVIGSVGILKDKKFNVLSEYLVEHEERAMIDGQIHDISLVANAVEKIKKKIEEDLNIKLTKVAIAAAGRFLRTITTKVEMSLEEEREIDKDIIRSLELTAVKKAEDEINKASNGKLYCVGYSVKSYYLNGYIISNLLAHKGETISAEVIVTFLPRSVVDSLYSVMNKVGLNVVSLTLEPIAAMEAAIPQSLRLLNLSLVDIGAGTSDIAISSKDSIVAYGMVPLAGDEITELIAQSYLVDFNTAEKIKKECSVYEKVKYIDVLGLENEIDSEEVKRLISPLIKKISEEIGKKITELNGGKSPNAVFLVGGGAHTPLLKEHLGEVLNLPLQRIGVRGREAVTDCICADNSLGSVGVTVLGIAMVSIKRLGHDFIDVMLNGNIISLFNSHNHTVMDVMLQGGIDPKVLIGKNGKNIKFTLNNIKRISFGSLANNAQIKVNGIPATIDDEVKEGDRIELSFAKDGKDAEPFVKDFVQNLYSTTFYINDIVESLEPIAFINGKKAGMEERIKEGDGVKIVYPSTLYDYIKYFDGNNNYKYYLNNKELSMEYAILDGDRIYKIKEEGSIEAIPKEDEINEVAISKIEEENSKELQVEQESTVEKEEESLRKEEQALGENTEVELKVYINDKNVSLKGKKEYIFIDVFNFFDFDLTIPKGNLVLQLNDNRADYYDKLKEGDRIKIYWDK